MSRLSLRPPVLGRKGLIRLTLTLRETEGPRRVLPPVIIEQIFIECLLCASQGLSSGRIPRRRGTGGGGVSHPGQWEMGGVPVLALFQAEGTALSKPNKRKRSH